ncbi:sensor histidine kinase [Butyrivibrio sp. INlla16]|uniref:sensor histidine kinase n=1 Tax=Butyrivibrio sp. INlla16 TaxID=1520807 RepID=UPI000881E060|nr:histidine kinase [Butyrivibrio sp. INlla16]SDB47539.1 Histidine kinase-, DNA gyrase B-, and HSP90-like ATPase [Butyrivibrio sp. INlla16]
MNKAPASFQENIRKTFIRFSVVPVALVSVMALILFVFSFALIMAISNRGENEAVNEKLTRMTNIYYQMMDDVGESLENNHLTVSRNDVFGILYDRTSEFEDIGDLIILSKDQKVLFKSKSSVPQFLTDGTSSNWGILKALKKARGKTASILYDKKLCIGKGVYRGEKLRFMIVYIVPSDVLSVASEIQSRYVIITDKNGWIYAANTNKLRDSYGQIDSRIAQNTGFIMADGGLFYVHKSVTDKGFGVYTITDMGWSVQLIIVLIVILAIVFLAIAFVTVRSTAKSSEEYTRDIRKIENALEEVQNGNLDVSLRIGSSKEFMTIGNDFNDMLKGLREQIERNNELAQNAAFAQVKQLESQFNPHFLFNTLDNIRFMAKIDPTAADKMIVSLSGILRYCIRDMREEVTVREDLDNLQFYLNILQIRFNKRFAYNIEVSEDIMDCLIPKLMLQPLLENAIKYGFGDREKLTVNIRGYQMQDELVFICEDDGAGIDEEQLWVIQNYLKEDENRTNHYGLYNIHRRIRLLYKGNYGLDVTSKKGEGTCVRMIIPKHS